MLEGLKGRATDPLADYRAQHPGTAAVPPAVQCQHDHWLASRGGAAEAPLTRAPGRAVSAPPIKKEMKVPGSLNPEIEAVKKPEPFKPGPPVELQMTKAPGSSGKFDLRSLPQTKPEKRERPEREEPTPNPTMVDTGDTGKQGNVPETAAFPAPNAPAPAPLANFAGLDFANWGNGHPPDTVGDVGPDYFIQSINTSLGVFRKTDGVLVAAFSYNTFMSQGNFGNLCDTNNFGDPVILYDTFEDRWVVTDFAFQLDGSSNVVNPPGAFQCFAVSKTGDPVNGGWNFYSINTAGGLGDYPKFGIWPDGIYMSANMFGYASGAPFQNPRVYAFNKAQMYAGAPSVQVVTFNAPASDFTLLPSNSRLQVGTPPNGTPNYFVSTWQFLNALTVYKFHVDWNSISASTFTGPDVPIAATSWPNAAVPNAPSQGGNSLDVLQIRAMMQNQYTNLGGVESLWTTHTVRRANTTGFAAPRWYQVNVTGGTVAANLPQATTWDPDAANVMYRFMPSLALDRAGDLALGYSTSSSTTKPAIKYAGRLAADPINTFSQTEQVLVQGTGTQTGTCGGTCTRWGDYSAMTLDPNGCTFWYTNMYYIADGLNHQTRIGSFAFPSCVPVGSGGTVSGTVTAAVGGAPISGAAITFGSRTTTTNGSGFYSFSSVPAGTYPSLSASSPGYIPGTAFSVVVSDATTTTQNFSLATAPASACLTDTTQADFQTGVPTAVDLTTSPGNVTLGKPDVVDQQNLSVTTSGFGFTSTTWFGQTFQPAISGPLVRVDLDLFCSGCTGTTPNITVSIRATSSDLPTGADLATATIPGFSSGSGGFFTATFASPPTLTAGTRYAVVVRAVSNPSAGTYAYVVSTGSPYANGRRVTSSNSGSTWTGQTTDVGFITYVNNGYVSPGNLVSGTKDANPAPGYTPNWQTISWNASTPANTALQFQVAASNSVTGPFNFVGPDGTASTFFTTSGASLSQFNGNRYLKYKAYLSTSSGLVTPTVNDVTICYQNVCLPIGTPGAFTTSTTSITSPQSNVPYTVGASSTSGVTYHWTYSGTGVTFQSNDTGSTSTLVDYSGAATSGNLCVVAQSNGCSSPAQCLAITVTAAPAPNPVRVVTVDASNGQNVIEWLNPTSGGYAGAGTIVRFSTSGYPATVTDGSSAGSVLGALNGKGKITHGGLGNGTTYYYSVFVDNGFGSYAGPVHGLGRPSNTPAQVNWAFNTAASAFAPVVVSPGGTGAVYGVSNDQYLHSMKRGLATGGGGTWPTGSPWKPFLMNDVAQDHPLVVDTTLVAGSARVDFASAMDGRVYAVDGPSGAFRWGAPASPSAGDAIQGAPAKMLVNGGSAYNLILAGTRNATLANRLLGLDAGTGATKFAFDNGAGASSIGMISGEAAVDTATNRVWFASRQMAGGTTQTVFCVQVSGTLASPVAAPCAGFNPPVIGDVDAPVTLFQNTLYVGANSGLVYALNATTGAQMWSVNPGTGAVRGRIARDNATNKIWFATSTRMYGYQDVGGNAFLSFNLGIAGGSSPILNAGKVYVGSSDGSLYEMDAATGANLKQTVLGLGVAGIGAPSMDTTNGLIHAGSENGITYAVAVPFP